jgi:hypothetical protein
MGQFSMGLCFLVRQASKENSFGSSERFHPLIQPGKGLYEHALNPERTFRPFYSFRSSSSMNLFTMKHFLEVDYEVILLSNGWIWY